MSTSNSSSVNSRPDSHEADDRLEQVTNINSNPGAEAGHQALPQAPACAVITKEQHSKKHKMNELTFDAYGFASIAVLAEHLQMPLNYVAIRHPFTRRLPVFQAQHPHGESLGGYFQPLPDAEAPPVWERLLLFRVGAIAARHLERKMGRSFKPILTHWTGGPDNATDLAKEFACQKGEEMQSVLQRADAEAETLVNAFWEQIEWVADRLVEDGVFHLANIPDGLFQRTSITLSPVVVT